jgi:oxygen-independent coproporphyrinogen-3 oxidase
LLKEWLLYCRLFDEKPLIREIHLGGGTPTFFSPKNLEDLINGILFLFAQIRRLRDEF